MIIEIAHDSDPARRQHPSSPFVQGPDRMPPRAEVASASQRRVGRGRRIHARSDGPRELPLGLGLDKWNGIACEVLTRMTLARRSRSKTPPIQRERTDRGVDNARVCRRRSLAAMSPAHGRVDYHLSGRRTLPKGPNIRLELDADHVGSQVFLDCSNPVDHRGRRGASSHPQYQRAARPPQVQPLQGRS